VQDGIEDYLLRAAKPAKRKGLSKDKHVGLRRDCAKPENGGSGGR
jgi:hypothetical protein